MYPLYNDEPQPSDKIPVVPWQPQWLHRGQLVVDQDLKRPFRPHHARRLRDNLRDNPLMAPPLRVNDYGDGTYGVTDGQHVLWALKDLGQDWIYCYVERGSRAAQARQVVGLAERAQVSALDRAFSGLVSQHDAALLIVVRILRECGYYLTRDRFGGDPHAVWAISTCLALYSPMSPNQRGLSVLPQPEVTPDQRLRRVLLLARDTWPEKVGRTQSVLLRALDMLFWHYGPPPQGFSRRAFMQRVGLLEPLELVEQARDQAYALGRNAALWALFLMVERYNLARRSGRLELPFAMDDESLPEGGLGEEDD